MSALPQDGSDHAHGKPMDFAACTRAIDVTLDSKLENMLLQDVHNVATSDFDVWFHLQLLGAHNQFNRT
jgi:hypothetical protein